MFYAAAASPPLTKVEHDHSYACPVGKEPPTHILVLTETNFCLPIDTKQADKEQVVTSLTVTEAERQYVESQTRQQSSCVLWHQVRTRRITGSICGRILHQKNKTDNLLRSVLYPKPMAVLPKPIEWGRNNEENAIKAYTTLMETQGHTNLVVTICGFIIHPSKGWLGASPDGFVCDPSSHEPCGILEVKCPDSKRDITAEEACNDPDFYCTFENGRLNQYFHQVQLQLYVCSDL